MIDDLTMVVYFSIGYTWILKGSETVIYLLNRFIGLNIIVIRYWLQFF